VRWLAHAGDSLYELCYLSEFGKSVRHLRDYDGRHRRRVGGLPVPTGVSLSPPTRSY